MAEIFDDYKDEKIFDLEQRVVRIEYFLRDLIEGAMDNMEKCMKDYVNEVGCCTSDELIGWIFDLKDIRWTMKDIYRIHKKLKDDGEF